MNDFLNDVYDLLPESVSSGDAAAAAPGNGDSSVSSGNAVNVYYQIDVHTVSGSDAGPQYTLFDKPLDEYTVSEGLLLIIVLLLICKFAWSVIKEGFKWLTW